MLEHWCRRFISCKGGDSIAAEEQLPQCWQAATQACHLHMGTCSHATRMADAGSIAFRNCHSSKQPLTSAHDRRHSLRTSVCSRLAVAALHSGVPGVGSTMWFRLRSSCRRAGSCCAMLRASRQLPSSVPDRSSSASAGAASSSSPSVPYTNFEQMHQRRMMSA